MDIEIIREARNRQPFQPFLLRLGDGCAFELVEGERMAMHPRSGRIYMFTGPDEVPQSFNATEVAALEYLGDEPLVVPHGR